MSDNSFASPLPNRKYFQSAEEAVINSNKRQTFKSNNDNEQTKQKKMKTQSKKTERILQNFVLGMNIGTGTFSKVCIANHLPTNQKVAVKIIDKSKIENEADRNRLHREIKIMRKVRHPNIVQLYQIIQTNKYIYLVTQYAARGQLFDHIISQNKLTQLQAGRFLLQLIDAIQYIHKLGVAHRDLKPENLLLDQRFNLKVIDFGLSNIYRQDSKLKTACGSPCYACPQMIKCQQYDGLKADIWSIGIILYAMCFGYLPFENQNQSVLYNSIKNGQFQIPEEASKELADLLQKILCVNPKQRATISQIRAHPFFKLSFPSILSCPQKYSMGIIFTLSDIPYEQSIEKQMKDQLKLDVTRLRQQIKNNKHNELTCTYYLILQRNLRQNNQSILNYYVTKINQINRYAIIEKTKANFDKRLVLKKELKAFDPYSESKTHYRTSMSPKAVSKAFKTIQKYKNVQKCRQQGCKEVGGKSVKKEKQYKHKQFGKFAPDNTLQSPFVKTQGKKKSKKSERKVKSGKKKSRNKSLPKSIKLKF